MDSTSIIGLLVICGLIIFLFVRFYDRVSKLRVFDRSGKFNSTNALFRYTKKTTIMTKSESNFFKMLNEVVADRYYVFPQIHLSTILENKVKGQNYVSAFKHINGKSIDFVLCDKETLAPVYAVELDDPTHDTDLRQERDREVERMFEIANLPLVRFRDYRNLRLDDIAQRFYEVRSNVKETP